MEPELAAELAAHDEAVAIAMEEKRRAVGYIGASIYCNIGASNALSKEGDFRDSRRDLGQLIVI